MSAYKNAGITTASGGQLTIMLYDATVRHLDNALELLLAHMNGKREPGKIEKISHSLLKAQEIIAELVTTLDMEQGGDIAKNLLALYRWFHSELLEANISQDSQRVTVVRNLMSELRDAWNDIVSRTAAVPGNNTQGISIAG
jgi:flagellar protein FliS